MASTASAKITSEKVLDAYLNSYTSFNDWLIGRRYRKLKDYFTGNSCLELGSAEGTGTKHLLDHFNKVVAVDGSPLAVASIKRKYPTERLVAVNSFFENMEFGIERFDTIVMAHILEHVDDPLQVLLQAKKFLAPNGVMIIDVPNGGSLHRHVGVKMGLLGKHTDLNEADLSIGHQRVYTPETFQEDINNAGLNIKEFGGMFIKVLSNTQTEKVFNQDQLEALFKVGEDHPHVAAEMFIVATN